MTAHLRWNPRQSMKNQEWGSASFFETVKLLSWRINEVTAAPNQVSGPRSRQQRWEGQRIVRSLRGIHLTRTEHPLLVSSVRPERLLPLLLHLRAVWKLRMNHRGALLCALRPARHTVPVFPRFPGGSSCWCPAQLVKKKARKKNPISAKLKLDELNR